MPSVHISACIFFFLFDVDEEKIYKCPCKMSKCLYHRCLASYANNWSGSSADLELKVQNNLIGVALLSALVVIERITSKGSQI